MKKQEQYEGINAGGILKCNIIKCYNVIEK